MIRITQGKLLKPKPKKK